MGAPRRRKREERSREASRARGRARRRPPTAAPPPEREDDLPPILQGIESEPWREDWLRLTPAERVLRNWKARLHIADPESAHDERSLPRL